MSNVIPQFDHSQFTFCAGAKQFLTEVSTLIAASARHPMVFDIVGRTGKFARFEMTHVERNSDNDVEAWRYQLAKHQPHNIPEVAGFSVVVLNE